MNHRPCVADELGRQACPHDLREELDRLELLSDDLSLRLSSASRGVEALECQEDHEPEEHREPGSEDTEDSGGAIPVLEVASRGRSAADQQHRRDGDRRDRRDDKPCPEETHELLTGVPRSSALCGSRSRILTLSATDC